MEYQIGDFSTISRLSIKTLRYYHDYGLLFPVRIDDETSYRYYNEKSLERVRVINTLKGMDFSLKDIKEILDKCADDCDVVEYMIQKSNEIQEKLLRYSKIHKDLETFLSSTRQEEVTRAMNDKDIIIKEVPDILIASLRFKGKYQEMGKAFGKLFRACGNCASAPFSLNHDGEYKEEDADIEVCVPLKRAINKDEIKSRILAGGKAVTLIHKGSYHEVGESYRTLIDYMISNNIKTRIPSREIYLKGPGMILPRSPKKYITEIQIFIE